MNITVNIDKNAQYIIDNLRMRGYSAYVVGGCVRDAIMGKLPSDWDITTSARPEQIQEVFGSLGIITIPTGIKHGTISVLIENTIYECTSYRVEEGYSDGRHPDKVNFSDRLEDDLCRRDFTVNAMAYSADDKLIDLYGGRQDIENKIIRCVGDPTSRFEEDALRILRAIRFATVLDFEIEPETLSSLIQKAKGLSAVSAERKRDELKKILLSNNPNRGIDLIFSCGINKYIPCKLINTKRMLDNLPLCFEARLSVIVAEGIDKLRLSKKEVQRVRLFKESPSPEKSVINARKILKKYGDDAISVCKLYEMNILASIVENEKKANPCLTLSSLALNGKNLSDLGIEPSNIGKVLNSLLDEVIVNPDLNNKDKLTELVLHKYTV